MKHVFISLPQEENIPGAFLELGKHRNNVDGKFGSSNWPRGDRSHLSTPAV